MYIRLYAYVFTYIMYKNKYLRLCQRNFALWLSKHQILSTTHLFKNPPQYLKSFS